MDNLDFVILGLFYYELFHASPDFSMASDNLCQQIMANML